MKVSKEDAILQLEKIKEPNRDTASPLSQVCGILRNTKMSSKQLTIALSEARKEATPNGGYFYNGSGKFAAIKYLKSII